MPRTAPAAVEPLGMPPKDAVGELIRGKTVRKTGRVIAFRNWSRRVPEPKTGPIDLNRFPFQSELYRAAGAHDEEVVVKKATQVGVSTWLLRVALYHADIRQKSSLYVFPKRQQMYDFADARIRAAIEASPYLLSRIPYGYVQNKGLKRIGLGWLYCRGSESKADLDSVDADVLVLDEYDTLRQENIPDAERRISGAPDGKIRRVGVPSVPGWGIDKAYAETDQRNWHVKCDRCNEIQQVTWDNVDLKEVRLVCSNCRKGPLDVRKGEWLAEYPDRPMKGYNIPRLIVPSVNLRAIIKASEATKPNEMQVHKNKDLAIAWTPAEGRLTDEAIEAASRDDLVAKAEAYAGGGLVTMGVDVKSKGNLHVRISLHHESRVRHAGSQEELNTWKTPLWIGEVQKFGELSALMRRFNVNMCVIDHLPETRSARALAERFPGRVYLCRFSTQHKPITVDPDMREVAVIRWMAIDAVVDMIRTQRNLLPEGKPPDYQAHLQNMHRVQDEDEHGRVKVEWRATGDFDYMMAEVYDLVAHDVFHWQRGVEEMGEVEERQLDELYEFERADLDRGTVDLGLDVPDYEPGFDD